MAEQYDVFISHASADRAWVEGFLLDGLADAGVGCILKSTFELGTPRLVAVEHAIARSKRTLLIITPAYLSDRASSIVDLLGQSYGQESGTWPVIPVILQPAALPTRLAMLTSLDMHDPATQVEGLERLCLTLQRPTPGPPPDPPCPYPGMVPFGEADSARFFGRARDVQELLSQLLRTSLLTVIGPSGSGKSSLVLAGLIPALRARPRPGAAAWQICAFRPGVRPQLALAAALGSAGEAPALQVQRIVGGSTQLLLVVDQFEEVFTVAHEDAAAFQQQLLDLSAIVGCRIILTVRADFYGDLMGSPLWPVVQAHRVDVAPLDERGLREAMVRPAEAVGVHIEPALIERLVRDAAGEPGVLPLIQETLVLLWERRQRRFLPLSAYELLVLTRDSYGTGIHTGLQVALARRADATLATLEAGGQLIARRLLLRLVQFGDGRADTRRQQPYAALRALDDDPLVFAHTVRQLSDHRLVILSGAETGRQRSVDLAHEALIGGWPTLRRWIDERRASEQVRRRLEDKAAEWQRMGRGAGGLLDAVEVLEARQWLESDDAAVLGADATVLLLLDASEAAVAAERRARESLHQRELDAVNERVRVQAEAARRLRRRAYIMTAVGIVAVLFAVFSGVALRAAVRARNIAQTQQLAEAAEAVRISDSENGLALALAAI